jgi:hypothetical protein
MSDTEKRIEKMVQHLRQERDELKVKLHLGKLDASDEWHELERKWGKLESKAKELGDATAESSKEVAAAAKLLGEEIGAGFKRIGQRF